MLVDTGLGGAFDYAAPAAAAAAVDTMGTNGVCRIERLNLEAPVMAWYNSQLHSIHRWHSGFDDVVFEMMLAAEEEGAAVEVEVEVEAEAELDHRNRPFFQKS